MSKAYHYVAHTDGLTFLETNDDWKVLLHLPDHYTVEQVKYCAFSDVRGKCFELLVSSEKLPESLTTDQDMRLIATYCVPEADVPPALSSLHVLWWDQDMCDWVKMYDERRTEDGTFEIIDWSRTDAKV